MSVATLADWLARIGRVQPADVDPGLDRVREVARRLGVLSPARQVVLVAGTNGKGSTVTLLHALARRAGWRTGLATSPHLRRYNERIVINDHVAGDDELVAAFERIEAARQEISLSVFDFGALAGLVIMGHSQLDLALLETGLGGRLDAFNMLEPDVSVITRIALDHQRWLGEDVEQIGAEKACIMRPGRHTFLADEAPPASVLDYGTAIGATLVRAGVDFTWQPDHAGFDYVDSKGKLAQVPPPCLPEASVAVAVAVARHLAMPLAPAEVKHVVATTRMAGRWQWLDTIPRTVLDVAHNPDAAALLAARLRRTPRGRCRAVVGILADKDVSGVLAPLVPEIDEWFLTALPDRRAASPAAMAGALSAVTARLSDREAPGRQEYDPDLVVSTYNTTAAALHAAIRGADEADLIVVFGSFPVVAAALDHLEQGSVARG